MTRSFRVTHFPRPLGEKARLASARKKLSANNRMDDSTSASNKSSDEFERVAAEEIYQLLSKHSKPFAEMIREVGDAALKEVLKEMKQEEETIVDDEAFPDGAMPEKSTDRKNKSRSKCTKKAFG